MKCIRCKRLREIDVELNTIKEKKFNALLDGKNVMVTEALQAYQDDKIIKDLTVYVPDFGLCILIDSLSCLPKDRETRYDGSNDDYDIYSTDDPEEYLQFAIPA